MKLSWKHGVAIAVGGILLGGTLSALGQNDETPVPEAEVVHFAKPGGPGGRGGPGGFKGHFGGLVRSEAVVEGEEEGTFNTIRVDRGELAAVDGNTLTIKEADSESRQVTVDDDTRIARDGERAEVGDLEVGDHVMAHRVKEGDGDFVTKHVHAISAERYAEMEEAREACTDDARATECERPKRGPRDRGGVRFSNEKDASAPAEPALEIEGSDA